LDVCSRFGTTALCRGDYAPRMKPEFRARLQAASRSFGPRFEPAATVRRRVDAKVGCL
jgi:hypothetical protein